MFNLSCDSHKATSMSDQVNFSGEILKECHYSCQFGDHIHCDSGDIMFLICHVIL